MCEYWGRRPGQLSLETLQRLAAELPKLGVRNIYLTGGEPMLHPDFDAIVAHFMEGGVGIRLSTNGTLLKSRDLSSLRGIKSLSVSLDGLKEVHDRIRGRAGCFDAVFEGIDRFRRFAPEIPMSVSVTVLPSNVGSLQELVHYCKERGIDELGFQPFVPSFSREPYRSSLSKEIESGLTDIRKAFAWLRECRDCTSNVKEYYSLCETFCSGDFAKLPHCRAGNDIFVINSDGSVAPCSGIRGAGNVETMDVRAILDSVEYGSLIRRAERRQCAQCLFYCFYYPVG